MAEIKGNYPGRFHVSEETERKIDELLSKMTLDEKIGQLNQRGSLKESDIQLLREGRIGSLLNLRGAEKVNEMQRIAVEETRLGIPLIIGDDVIHGYRTIFPIPLAEAASWDPQLMEETAEIAAKEASSAGIRWFFAPMVDIARDPRWGRIAEGPGEDTYLGSVMAAAKVRGFQKKDENGVPRVIACPKHFAAYGAAQAGIDYFTADISERTLREVYLPPFKAALDAGAGTIMSGFHDLNGIPCTGNHLLMKDILIDEWGFDGFVVSDWGSVGEMVEHGFAADRKEAAEKGIKAGVHMDMHTMSYLDHLAQLVNQGKVPIEAVDEAVRRILRVKFRLGLFENPYYSNDEKEKSVLLHGEHLAKAREMAGKSIVLLKNEGDILPLDRSIKSLAVVGPLADVQWALQGCWGSQGRFEDVVSVMDGIRRKLGNDAEITYAEGCDLRKPGDENSDKINEAVEAVKQSDIAVVVVGEGFDYSGENNSRAFIDLPGSQLDLLKAVYATGKPVVMVLVHGRPMSIGWAAENIPGIIAAWHPGTQAGNAIADILFGDRNPSGKLPVTFPRSVAQVPIFYNHKKVGRPTEKRYLDCPVTPLYPFGYGLSYTTFEYSDIQLSAEVISADEELTVSVNVKNTGSREGEEVVQLYIQDVAGSITRPVKELKGFQRVALKPGEQKTVSFALGKEQLGYLDAGYRFAVEPGSFKVWIGTSSVEGLEAGFEIADH